MSPGMCVKSTRGVLCTVVVSGTGGSCYILFGRTKQCLKFYLWANIQTFGDGFAIHYVTRLPNEFQAVDIWGNVV